HYSSKYPEAQELTETIEKNLRREVKWNEQISKASTLAARTLGRSSSFISPGGGRDACLWQQSQRINSFTRAKRFDRQHRVSSESW
ncbi:hypothetical protein, partial [Lacticaseibacillus manihotivorans]